MMIKYLRVTFAVLLTVSTLTGCAGHHSLPDQNTAAGQSNKPAPEQTAVPANGISNPAVFPDASAAYEKLTAYKTEDYLQESVADFNASLASTPDELTEFLAAQADVINVISPDDENYDFFTTTMTFSADELYCEHMGEEFTFSAYVSKKSRPYSYLDEEGNTVYEFSCIVNFDIAYSIDTPELITVAERDRILLTFQEEMQNYLNGLSEAEIADSDIKKMLLDKSAELEDSLSTENMKLSPCEIYLIEISDAGKEIIWQ